MDAETREEEEEDASSSSSNNNRVHEDVIEEGCLRNVDDFLLRLCFRCSRSPLPPPIDFFMLPFAMLTTLTAITAVMIPLEMLFVTFSSLSASSHQSTFSQPTTALKDTYLCPASQKFVEQPRR